MNYSEQGIFNLIAATTQHAFTPYKITTGKNIDVSDRINQTYLIRVRFAKSILLRIWCDCSYNFDYEKLSKKIILAQKSLRRQAIKQYK